MEKLIRELSCVLTEDERNLRGAELAAAITDSDKLEAEKKTFGTQWEERKEEVDGRIHRLASARNTGSEKRHVECSQHPNHATKMVDVYRDDTGEKLFSRGMEPNELQRGMFQDDEPAAGSH